MGTESDQKLFVVPLAFNAESNGDCILSTPNGAEFKVHRVILSMASPIFADPTR